MRATFSPTEPQKAMARPGNRARARTPATWGAVVGEAVWAIVRLVFAAVLPTFLRTAVARADGAFPTAQSILLDATQPSHIVLATNFGLVTTLDGGESWSYGCETPLSANAFQYGAAAPMSARIWALASGSLVFSDDRGCSWTTARGTGEGAEASWEGATVRDYFVDRGDPRHVVAIVSPKGDTGTVLVLSSDEGTTFAATPLLSVDPQGSLDGVEIAQRSGALYVVERPGPEHRWTLAVSRDLGITWHPQDIESWVEAHAGARAAVTLAGVDRDDDRRVYLRVRSGSGDAMSDGLAVTGDSGVSLTFPLTMPGATFAAFLQRADGTLLLAGRDAAGSSLAYRSLDRGQSFTAWSVAPLRITGLAESGGTLFAAADNFTDKVALATSRDEGTWKGILSFDRISAVQGCLLSVCQSDCQKKAELGLFAAAVCTNSSEGTATDAGPHEQAKAGCGCSSASQDGGSAVWMAGATLALIFAKRRKF